VREQDGEIFVMQEFRRKGGKAVQEFRSSEFNTTNQSRVTI
jgi:hypothetical protein